ncbi:SET and MYND domain-containing protein 4-like [Daktulosphaira vitifoliae]|uniref:SET and MYND domain-containing protein 4-like n=1 Tax=Daktulosphaira vitifoliae TaxID=58002 RepID=UPI0021AA693A|nr:SET and MYND domain-containing protein 4-like [Daktulosphaira vitifoliae]
MHKSFLNEHTKFRDSLNTEDLDKFSNFFNDKDKIKYIYERLYNESIKIDIDESQQSRAIGKNGTKVLEIKKTGTKYFQKSDNIQALHWYSIAILYCPQVTNDWLKQLSILYANRSACLYHLKFYDLAIADIQRAFEHEYPNELRYKVYERKAKCLLATNRLKSALESFKATLQTLDDSNLSLEKRRKWQLDVQIMVAMLSQDKNAKKDVELKNNKDSHKLYGAPNDLYPAATNAMKIEYNSLEGRHARASRNIPVGKVILIEKAYASVLLQKYGHSHCTNCFNKLIAPLPCPGCSNVAFCDESCKEVAMKSYHAFECLMMPTLFSHEISISCLIALRIITQKPLKYFTSIEFYLNKLQESKLPSIKYEPNDYINLYSLVTHRESRSIHDILHRAHLATYFLWNLKKTNYFPKHDNENEFLTDDEAFIGSLILHHLELLQFNAFEVSEIQDSSGNDQHSIFIGGSVYPTLALLNHSCNPCVVRYHKGTSVIVQTIRELDVDDPITENYGPMFAFHTKDERQNTLKKRYWFECHCIACSQDWPLYNEMEMSRSLRIKCSNCKNAITISSESMDFTAKCNICFKSTNLFEDLKVLQKTESLFSEAKICMGNGDYLKALPILSSLLTLFHKHLVQPFKDYHLCQEAVKKCILALGNKQKRIIK